VCKGESARSRERWGAGLAFESRLVNNCNVTHRTVVLVWKLAAACLVASRVLQATLAMAQASAKSNPQGKGEQSSFAVPASGGVRVGAAAAELQGDDSMIIAGGITAGRASGLEGKLRAVAIVLEKQPFGRFAIVACDILMMTRSHLDPVAEAIEKETGIPFSHILINCTHTHHAPSTVVLHGYGLDETFTKRVQRAIISAVKQASANLSTSECQLFFQLSTENTVGQNSRMLLSDGQVYWVGPQDSFVRPTGPFDPELPVLAFRDSDGKLKATIFNHSTHTIGALEPGKRSPGFYGLATQRIEAERGGIACFLEGASGSTHNLTLTGREAMERIGAAVEQALNKAEPRPVTRLAAIKRPFTFRVRNFDEAQEDEAVSDYCRKYVPAAANQIITVFRNMRKQLAPQRGQERETWLQALLIGDIAIVGVPAEFFTKLGLDIKNRSPLRYTYIAELANDWIGYLPDVDGHKLGGYQTWTGFHSYAEPGTGERIVEEVTAMLRELAGS
jgi:neutral ceramidase